MKTKTLIIFFFLSKLLSAQPDLTIDSIVVKVSNDTVYIWDYNAWEQCGFQLEYSVDIIDSVITIIQTDAAGDLTTCYGYHDFIVPIVNLYENNYRIDIYRDCLYEDIRFIKTFWYEHHFPGLNESIILFPDSIFLSKDSVSDSCKIINNSNQIVYLDSIQNKSYSSYYCNIKINDEYKYYHLNITNYEQSDSIHMIINPLDTVTFIIADVDVCPICKKFNSEYLKDTLVFKFSTDSNFIVEKFLLLNSDISLDIEDDNIKIISFSLSQNYPNPFNPLTRITYEIPLSGLVTIKIYDILGNEIATLVNEEKNPGKYYINFDGAGFASGLYFYRITCGNYSETKKMILIK